MQSKFFNGQVDYTSSGDSWKIYARTGVALLIFIILTLSSTVLFMNYTDVGMYPLFVSLCIVVCLLQSVYMYCFGDLLNKAFTLNSKYKFITLKSNKKDDDALVMIIN